MEIFSEIGLRKIFWSPQIRRQVSAHGNAYMWELAYSDIMSLFFMGGDLAPSLGDEKKFRG